ncbi:hypothetical protein [Rubritalea tangerina]|uniref:Glycosyl-4,4'-diaponeurosporenoate acyltransferase n=1 Tax=Rubritalea tangerina TaxID=430798 RepID=A0ABW4ZE60_9BACT
MSNLTIILINAIGIPCTHLAISCLCTRLPLKYFSKPRIFLKTARWESHFYKHFLRVHRWKHLLPDGGAWFAGFKKSTLSHHSSQYLERFLFETQRSEICHWLQMPAIATFALWTPAPWHLVILVYAIASNLPSIIIQRYNRARLNNLLLRLRGQDR